MSEKKSTVLRAVPDERVAPHTSGMPILLALILALVICTTGFVVGCISSGAVWGILLIILGIVCWVVCPFIIAGLKVVAPNQAIVLTLFGNYYGTLKTPGFYFVNPFVTSNAPAGKGSSSVSLQNGSVSLSTTDSGSRKISLKTRTLDNNKQKVNDALGNPIIIGSVVIWHVADPTRAVFAVDNFEEYLSTQCDSTIRNIARLYPYDSMKDGDEDASEAEKTLRGSSSEVSEIMQNELSQRVADAGIVIEDVRITTLAYSDEIAAAMLQRQQAVAIIAARQKIVEGAVSMVKMAIDQLSEEEVVVLDEERKAAMVSNLLVVLCGNKDAQPIVNSGSIY